MNRVFTSLAFAAILLTASSLTSCLQKPAATDSTAQSGSDPTEYLPKFSDGSDGSVNVEIKVPGPGSLSLSLTMQWKSGCEVWDYEKACVAPGTLSGFAGYYYAGTCGFRSGPGTALVCNYTEGAGIGGPGTWIHEDAPNRVAGCVKEWFDGRDRVNDAVMSNLDGHHKHWAESNRLGSPYASECSRKIRAICRSNPQIPACGKVTVYEIQDSTCESAGQASYDAYKTSRFNGLTSNQLCADYGNEWGISAQGQNRCKHMAGVYSLYEQHGDKYNRCVSLCETKIADNCRATSGR